MSFSNRTVTPCRDPKMRTRARAHVRSGLIREVIHLRISFIREPLAFGIGILWAILIAEYLRGGARQVRQRRVAWIKKPRSVPTSMMSKGTRAKPRRSGATVNYRGCQMRPTEAFGLLGGLWRPHCFSRILRDVRAGRGEGVHLLPEFRRDIETVERNAYLEESDSF
jgi:hypothetical protein